MVKGVKEIIQLPDTLTVDLQNQKNFRVTGTLDRWMYTFDVTLTFEPDVDYDDGRYVDLSVWIPEFRGSGHALLAIDPEFLEFLSRSVRDVDDFESELEQHCMGETVSKNVTCQLTGEDNNAFSVMGRVSEALKRAQASREEVQNYRDEATSGDYDNLLQVSIKYLENNGVDWW